MTELERQSFKSLFRDYEKLYSEYEKIKSENDFLRKRENKLQLIEQMFKSGTIDLKELSDLVKGSEEWN